VKFTTTLKIAPIASMVKRVPYFVKFPVSFTSFKKVFVIGRCINDHAATMIPNTNGLQLTRLHNVAGTHPIKLFWH
jgi:hypothetical protein